MKLVTFTPNDQPRTRGVGQPRPGLVLNDWVIELGAPHDLPDSLLGLIEAGPDAWEGLRCLAAELAGEDLGHAVPALRGCPTALPLEQVTLCPPLLRPPSLRDFYAFEQHVAAAHANRGRPVADEWYQFPAFYYTNPNSLYGSGEVIPYPAYTAALDFELEVACIIGRPGINIPAEQAEDYIFGYTIFNDWSARDVQRAEMKIGLGPAKGKDFASSLGPWIVTPDELQGRRAGRPGVFDLEMRAAINGQPVSLGNWRDVHYSFGEMIARASQDAALLPGDVIGSGTVGSGCLLELTRGAGPWLQPGDLVELEIECLGRLSNRVGQPSGG